MRQWREHHDDSRLHFFKNLPTETYIRLMKRTACLVGNSSSGIREGAYIGTPVVNIGSRQEMRERGRNVLDAASESGAIRDAIREQIDHGPYPMEPIYGNGDAGEKVAAILAGYGTIDVQKRITY